MLCCVRKLHHAPLPKKPVMMVTGVRFGALADMLSVDALSSDALASSWSAALPLAASSAVREEMRLALHRLEISTMTLASTSVPTMNAAASQGDCSPSQW